MAIALLLAIGRTISSRSSTSAGCFACKQDGKARSRWASSADTQQHQLECVVPGEARKGGCPVHQLARSWLQYRLTRASVQRASKSKLPPPDFRALAVESERSLTSTPKNSYGTLAKTIKTINCSFLPPSYVYLTWLAMRLPYLLRGLRRI
jgi:hypothetical protein